MSDFFLKVKKSLRISNVYLDDEIESNIDACFCELKRVGIKTDSKDALIQKCVELYCKSEFNYNNSAERYKAAFEKMRDALSLSTDYTEVKTDE